MKVKSGFVLRKIGPKFMAVPVGEMTKKIKGMISLSESGYELWQLLQTPDGTDIDAMVAKLLEIYEVEEEVARHDVIEFVNGLKDKKLIEE